MAHAHRTPARPVPDAHPDGRATGLIAPPEPESARAPAPLTPVKAAPPPPIQLPSRPDDAQRQLQLDRMKRRAAALLVIAAIVYVIAKLFENLHPAIGFVRATAEASMVGGLADWFAVTALFRHPLGIPIPHTAILPARKERLGRTLGNFVQNHFLSREVLAHRLSTMRIAERLAHWLSEPSNAKLIARQVATGLARSVEALPDEEI